MLGSITPLILTLDEAANMERTLAQLTWARDIVVVDSGSTDGTREILTRHPAVRVFERPFTTHTEQWNFALEKTGIRTEWVLALDADFVLSDALVAEIEALAPLPEVAGYRASFVYCVDGRPLRGTVYPPVVVLYRANKARYRQDGHTQRVEIDGPIEALAATIFHDDRKPLSQWLGAQARYARLECEKLATTPFGALGIADRVRRLILVAPLAMFFYCLIVRGGLLDGKAGLFYALQRAIAEGFLSLYLLRHGMKKMVRGRPV